MSARAWNESRADKRIQKKLDDVPLKDIQIKDYVRDTDLTGLPKNVAYRVDGVHVYADIVNLKDMLQTTQVEGEMCHRRVLRFLNLHYRAASRILDNEGVMLIDFHNQRLHSVVAKPYGDEAQRVHRAIAIGQLLIDALAQTGEDADHPAAQVRVGIDTGKALAVNNGRRGHREPLFLGQPANQAAKRSGGGSATGIYLTNSARLSIGLASVKDENATALTAAEVATSQEKAALTSTVDGVVKEWQKDLEANPIGKFEFSAHTPPFSDLDMESLSVKNSRRQDAIAVYADIDGFTRYVGERIDDDTKAKHVVRALHVVRSELDAVLHEDFKGRKVRFIGDCVHGLMAEGTAQNTDAESSVSTMVLCAGGMRSSFDLALAKLKADGTDASSLGIQIGFEYGPMTATRLGLKGALIRCSVSRGTLAAETEQGRCGGSETALGQVAYDKASAAARAIFGSARKRQGLTYPVALEELAAKDDKTAKLAKAAASAGLLQPATSAPDPYAFRDQPSGPAKRNGFA
ncbi:adenylate/guanylate cyclase domain-containing protein [Pseudoxanthomonas sp. PXM02]|uniref:adenylate/guanylate cyclase domain-containing protein n=1 Tax=Pseudoxanthomonas sp. PXM02 TaxID=2769294 RepID=UPI001783AB0B|nr:adenylate/guanylate cyclase domain-containing protein [Pseudoxanthomonas sp. PXM02]MBD9477388.1 transcriptional regulator [Pseudoxanthomonas sp. PXM02]